MPFFFRQPLPFLLEKYEVPLLGELKSLNHPLINMGVGRGGFKYERKETSQREIARINRVFQCLISSNNIKRV